MQEKVSVIICTVNPKSDILYRAIKSVCNQTYKNWEIIVVDDSGICSNNEEQFFSSLIDKIPLKYVKHASNMGGATARNTGIKNVSGKYVAFLDDDDEWHLRKLELQVSKLEKLDETWGGVTCNYYEVFENQIKLQNIFIEGNLMRELLLMKIGLAAGSTLLCKREIFDNLGFFDETFIRHQDLEFMIRYFRIYKLAVVSEPLAWIYKSINYHTRKNAIQLVEIKEKYLKKFEKDIELFDRITQRTIYCEHWLEISYIMLLFKEYKLALQYFKLANSYYKVSKLRMAKIIYNAIKHFAVQYFRKKND